MQKKVVKARKGLDENRPAPDSQGCQGLPKCSVRWEKFKWRGGCACSGVKWALEVGRRNEGGGFGAREGNGGVSEVWQTMGCTLP